jgi:predicted small metal-binding protein
MSKEFSCRDAGNMNCDFQARGETTDDVMKQATAHVRSAHNYEQVPPEMASKIRGAIHDTGKTSAAGASSGSGSGSSGSGSSGSGSSGSGGRGSGSGGSGSSTPAGR